MRIPKVPKQQQEIKQLRNKIRRNVTSISCSKRAIKLNRRETKIRFLILPSSPYNTVLKRERIISRSLLLPSLVISLINRVVRLRQRREDERRKTSSITREENTLAGIQRGGDFFIYVKVHRQEVVSSARYTRTREYNFPSVSPPVNELSCRLAQRQLKFSLSGKCG